jgi:hypothetical protein
MDKSEELATATADFLQRWGEYSPSESEPQAWLGADLLTHLGCSYMDYVLDGDQYLQDRSLICPTEDAISKSDWLPQSFKTLLPVVINTYGQQSTNISSLLTGINRHKLVESFLDSEECAYSLAASILIFIEMYEDAYELDATAAGDVCDILNDWLKPDDPWSQLPGIGVVAARLFGDVWRHVVIQDEGDDAVGNCSQSGHHSVEDGYVMVGILAARTRPPFLPGLFKGESLIHANDLPDLSGAL